MRYRMRFLGYDARGRERWRGTGLDPKPGGMTEIFDKRDVLCSIELTGR